MKLTENFDSKEFGCSDGTEVPESLMDNLKLLAENLQVLRGYLDAPVSINSGYRTESYNKKIGGAKKSQHKEAKAADIVVKGYSPNAVADAIEYLIEEGRMKEGGLGRYNSFTHYDVREGKARWDYR